ncbi:MAG: hypothetical protein IJ189_05860 [Clostridia bacterium]|nr:hypothetical protein [Clostridia bacterium]
MKDENMKRMLEGAFPETPKLFKERMAQVQADQTANRKTGRRLTRVGLIAMLAVMMCGGALAAMNHYGVLNFRAGWGDDFYFTLPGAEDMIHYDVARAQTGGLSWQVKEAAYDGRVLRILYSVTDPAMEITEENIDAAQAAMHKKHGVYLECEGNGEIYVNGQGVNLSTMDFRPGETKGEIEGWFDCKMEGYETNGYIKPEGEITVSLPFHYSDEAMKASNPAGMTFTMNVGDVASRYAVQLPAPYTLDSGSVVSFTDLHFSPVTVFMDVEITLPKERTASLPEDRESIEYFYALQEFPEDQVFWNTHMENEKGETLGASRDGSASTDVDDEGRLVLKYHFEFAPRDKYTAINYLCLGDQWKAPIPLQYQEKPRESAPTAAPQAAE